MEEFFDLFEQIYIINLPSRKDRYGEMVIQLGRVGLGINSSKVQFFPAIRPNDAGGFRSIGARGCFLSHLGVIDDACSRGLKSIAIFEDDLDFACRFEILASRVFAALSEKEWSVFYGGYRLSDVLVDTGEACIELPPECNVVTAHFVAFRGDAIAATQSYLKILLTRPPGDPRGGPMDVDGAYSWFRKAHPEMQTWLAVPELGYQRSSESSITASIGYRRLPLVKQGLAILRRVKRLRQAHP